ncbi:MAG TPA: hypothetical protein PLD59_11990 [Tepidisphaeraceae bacterium]|nr:hypothetical protein [Tepidisphaeraceae bacterium]
MDSTTPFPGWFDVPAMIERSSPRARSNWWRWVVASALIGLMVAMLSGGSNATADLMIRLFTGVVLVVLMVIGGGVVVALNRAAAAERDQVEQVERAVTLRQWSVAAAILHQLLLRPMLSHRARVEALIYLSNVLGRYHKFAEAIEVQTYLLQTVEMDGMTSFGLRASRAMAMLREDHLLDADRALSEMKRMPGAAETGLFALASIFRDVKTGHHDEAIEQFEKHRDVIARQLGHRSADAHLLVALSYRARGMTDQAAVHFRNATLLAPSIELRRRYPESAVLFESFSAAPAPPEAS